MLGDHHLVIVSGLNPLEDGMVFDATNWPLHITIVGKFTINGEPNELLDTLEKITSITKPLRILVKERAMFGPEKDVPVFTVNGGDELGNLHNSLIKLLTGNYKAVFEHPEYIKSGFVPHITSRKEDGLKSGEKIIVNSLSVVDIQPSDSPSERRVIRTIKFGGSF